MNDAPEPRRGLSRRAVLRGVAAFGAVSAIPSIGRAASLLSSPVRFAVIGDWGSGDERSCEIAHQIAVTHDHRALDLIVTAGDNIYPDGAASRFAEKFERPFEEVIERRVPVYASLGNHDVREGASAQMRYPLFNMNERNYYHVQTNNGLVDLFVLDSNDMESRQLAWLDASLARSAATWKVAVLHHPPFSSGRRHGSNEKLRRKLHPLFARHGVDVVFTGHDHVYQRVTPQDGVQYIVSGAGGKVRFGNLRRDHLVAAGYDDGCHFVLVEADAARFDVSAVTADGVVVDATRLTPKRAAWLRAS